MNNEKTKTELKAELMNAERVWDEAFEALCELDATVFPTSFDLDDPFVEEFRAARRQASARLSDAHNATIAALNAFLAAFDDQPADDQPADDQPVEEALAALRADRRARVEAMAETFAAEPSTSRNEAFRRHGGRRDTLTADVALARRLAALRAVREVCDGVTDSNSRGLLDRLDALYAGYGIPVEAR